MPYARDWFRGVINIRGFVRRRGFGSLYCWRYGNCVEPPSQDLSVVTLNLALEVNCALQVDGLLGLRGGDAFTSSSPADPGAPAYYGNQFIDSAGEQWQEIDLRILSQTPQF